jgi:hypothetical protein
MLLISVGHHRRVCPAPTTGTGGTVMQLLGKGSSPKRERRSDGGGQRCPLLPFPTPPPARRTRSSLKAAAMTVGGFPAVILRAGGALAVDMCRYPVRWLFTRGREPIVPESRCHGPTRYPMSTRDPDSVTGKMRRPTREFFKHWPNRAVCSGSSWTSGIMHARPGHGAPNDDDDVAKQMNSCRPTRWSREEKGRSGVGGQPSCSHRAVRRSNAFEQKAVSVWRRAVACDGG